MIIKIGNKQIDYVENEDFKELVTSLKHAGIDTRPELEAFYDHLDFDSKIETSKIVSHQLSDMFGNISEIKVDTLWDLFLNFF